MTTPSAKPPERDLRRIFRTELLFVSRFGLIGVAATVTHLVVAFALLKVSRLPVLGANLVAFLIAFGVSFSGNYFWTFRARGGIRSAVGRYLLIASTAFLINNVVLVALIRDDRLSPFAATAVAALVVPCFTFLASRFWGFKSAHAPDV